ncbi:MFS transporter [Streptomyces sp. S.PB5]|uniref:MFS transporter n=1 Tax=Streptomyces sp. S.PB5 TaxID=3020844 RepID=UPI0025B08B0E|nr:MFS transporter [Streptomyces sp. S.PB5]MDN3027093.1 MFS transporter [Streptomyces sp. S.PB5]
MPNVAPQPEPLEDTPAGAPAEGRPAAPRRMNATTVLWVTLAVFAQESVWNFYDAQVPSELRHYIASAGLVGLIMGMDNVLGVLIQPWTGFLSDRRARDGKSRWAIILTGAALSSVPFALIPWTHTLPLLLMCVVGFAAMANAFKGITETLVSDYVAPSHRGKAQGFVKAGVSLTIVVSSLISLLVVDRSTTLAFAIPPVLMLLILTTSWFFLGRRHHTATLSPTDWASAAEPHPLQPPSDDFASPWGVIKDMVREPSRARALLMLGIFCFAGMWSALRTLLTPYGTETLSLSRGSAGGLALPGAVAFLVCVVPLAYASSRLGQVRAMRYGVGVFIVGLLIGFGVPTVPGTVISLVIASVGYAAFAVNALVALWDLAPSRHVLGTYTGLYTVASSTGAALGPALLGLTVDATGWRFMLLNGAVFATVTFAVFTRLARRIAPTAP